MTTTTRTYSDLIKFDTLEARFRYLALYGFVGDETFGSDRWLNQQFYTSRRWRQVADYVRVRDDGLDLGVRDFPIHGRILVHHMNPLTKFDLVDFNPDVLDPEFLISVSHRTHNAIHYGTEEHLPRPFVPRAPGDTQLWEPINNTLGDPDDNRQLRTSRPERRSPYPQRSQHVSARDEGVLRRPIRGRLRRRRRS